MFNSLIRFARIGALKALALFGTDMPEESHISIPKLEEISIDELVSRQSR